MKNYGREVYPYKQIQKYSLRQHINHLNQLKQTRQHTPFSSPPQYAQTPASITPHRTPLSHPVSSYRQQPPNIFSDIHCKFTNNSVEHLPRKQCNDIRQTTMRSYQTPSTTHSYNFKGAQLQLKNHLNQLENETKFSLRSFKIQKAQRAATRTDFARTPHISEPRHRTQYTSSPLSDYRHTEQRNSDVDSSKYSLRNGNINENKPEVLLNLNYVDLTQPIHYLGNTSIQRTIRIDNYENRSLCLSRQTHRGCKCRPKCLWANRWLQVIGGCDTDKHHRIKDQKGLEANLKQIQRDLHRTQPDHPAFKQPKMLDMLKTVLTQYAHIDQEVGYVQGMNFVASALVYHTGNAEDALRILSYLMKVSGYRNIFLGQLQLGRSIATKLEQQLRRTVHDLWSHLTEQCIQFQLFASSWYFSLCGSFVPLDAMHIVIDKFITKGFAGINEILLTLLIRKKEQLLTLEDSELMLEFSNQKLCQDGDSINWQDVKERSDSLQLPHIKL